MFHILSEVYEVLELKVVLETHLKRPCFLDNSSGCETTVSTCIYYKSVWTGIRARDLGVRIRDSNHYPVGADKKVSQSLPLYIAIRMSRNCYYVLMDILSL